MLLDNFLYHLQHIDRFSYLLGFLFGCLFCFLFWVTDTFIISKFKGSENSQDKK